MIKMVFTLRRLPQLSRQEFQRYWLDHHGPLVRDRAEVLRIRCYVQVHTLEHPVNQGLRDSRSGPEAYDGVAELWWDSLDDLAPANPTEERRRAALELLEDEKNFIDLARSPLWIGEEHELLGFP